MAKEDKKDKAALTEQEVAKEATVAEAEIKEEEQAEIANFADKKVEAVEAEAEDETKDKKTKKTKKSDKKAKKARPRSQKYLEKTADFDKTEMHPIDEAFELVKKNSYAKFGGSVDLHVKIAKVKAKKGPGETFRALVDMPNGTGKSKEIVILTEEVIEEIAKSKQANADIYLANPEIMPKVGKIARILGTQGKMPSPKSGTVTSDIDKTKEALEGGRVELRADAGNVLHQTIGKIDWEDEKLRKNFDAIMAVLPRTKIISMTIAPTMGSGVKIAFKK